MVLTESFQVALGGEAHPFSLKGTDERTYALETFSDARVLVVIFMCNHCPYIQACIDRLVALQRDFADRSVRFVGINSNDSTDYPEDNFEAMQAFFIEKKMNFPYLHDVAQQVAREYDAVCTPDIFAYDAQRKLQYHGRIDNNWKDASKVTSHELRDALDALVNGRVPGQVQHPSMGCSIKWRD